jgi:nitric oxide reductase subunit B
MGTTRLWKWLGIIFVLSFAVLGWLGREIYRAAPPIAHVQEKGGPLLYTAEQVQDGQRAWRAAGGQQLGSVWGHGAYVAPDWSADWLHREALALRTLLARKHFGAGYAQLDVAGQASVDALLKQEMRANTHDPASNTVFVSPERAAAIAEVQQHYTSLFGAAPEFASLREQYAMPENALPAAADRQALAAFFF